MTLNHDTMNPITEDDIANYLANTPDFFHRHAELLASVQINSPHGNRAVSLQERQAEMLREKIRALELRMMDMIRHGSENMVISGRLHRWALQLLAVAGDDDLPSAIVSEIQEQFLVPQAALRLWDLPERHAAQPFAQGVSEDVRSFASSLTQPYCGVNSGFEAAGWLEDPTQATSLAMIPLREGPINSTTPAFGLLVLASPDSQRFTSGMGTDFLERLAELASAALARLLKH
ncbi:MAG: hypothetical protein RL522_1070 [Pseudomonadota bacterium]|jgi:uncharacterized protein YigA (DUF484 family)